MESTTFFAQRRVFGTSIAQPIIAFLARHIDTIIACDLLARAALDVAIPAYGHVALMALVRVRGAHPTVVKRATGRSCFTIMAVVRVHTMWRRCTYKGSKISTRGPFYNIRTVVACKPRMILNPNLTGKQGWFLWLVLFYHAPLPTSNPAPQCSSMWIGTSSISANVSLHRAHRYGSAGLPDLMQSFPLCHSPQYLHAMMGVNANGKNPLYHSCGLISCQTVRYVEISGLTRMENFLPATRSAATRVLRQRI